MLQIHPNYTITQKESHSITISQKNLTNIKKNPTFQVIVIHSLGKPLLRELAWQKYAFNNIRKSLKMQISSSSKCEIKVLEEISASLFLSLEYKIDRSQWSQQSNHTINHASCFNNNL